MEEIVRENEKRSRPVNLLTAAAVEPPDMVVTAPPDPLTLAPGQSVEIAVKVARREGFKGKVPLVVLGLPEGVTANAPEVPEDKDEAKITLKAEGSAKPGETEVIAAGQTRIDDQRQVLHAAAPVLLTVLAHGAAVADPTARPADPGYCRPLHHPFSQPQERQPTCLHGFLS
jgi:hypothetical protein